MKLDDALNKAFEITMENGIKGNKELKKDIPKEKLDISEKYFKLIGKLFFSYFRENLINVLMNNDKELEEK